MSREMPTANTETYRVKIARLGNGNASVIDATYGPYATLGAAKSAVTRESHGRIVVAVRVERSVHNWEEVAL